MILYLVSEGARVGLVGKNGLTVADMANGPRERIQPFPDTSRCSRSWVRRTRTAACPADAREATEHTELLGHGEHGGISHKEHKDHQGLCVLRALRGRVSPSSFDRRMEQAAGQDVMGFPWLVGGFGEEYPSSDSRGHRAHGGCRPQRTRRSPRPCVSVIFVAETSVISVPSVATFLRVLSGQVL